MLVRPLCWVWIKLRNLFCNKLLNLICIKLSILICIRLLSLLCNRLPNLPCYRLLAYCVPSRLQSIIPEEENGWAFLAKTVSFCAIWPQYLAHISFCISERMFAEMGHSWPLFKKVDSKKNLRMTEFELRVSGVEATALPTEPQPLPNSANFYLLPTTVWRLFSAQNRQTRWSRTLSNFVYIANDWMLVCYNILWFQGSSNNNPVLYGP